MTQINYAREKLKLYSNGNLPAIEDSLYWEYMMPTNMAKRLCNSEENFDMQWKSIDAKMLGLLCKTEPPDVIKQAVEEWIAQPTPKFLYLSSLPNTVNVWHNLTDWITRLIGLSHTSYIEVRGKSKSLTADDKKIVSKISEEFLANSDQINMVTFIHKEENFFDF
tara:strand:- start:1040 stop:1534 length:495 start_codon:yes stop_codon:yes gene_type:complete